MEEEYKKEAQELKEILVNKGKDDELIQLTTKRNLDERLKIKDIYISTFGNNLIEDLKTKLSGKTEDAFVALYTDLAEYDADCCKNAIKGLGTDEDCLIEIIGTRPGWFLKKVKEKYLEKYKVELEKDVIGDTSGIFQKLLVALLQCSRRTNKQPDLAECEKIAQNLFSKDKKDDPEFIKYFANSSPHELLEIARAYHKNTNKLLMKGIEDEFSSDERKLLQTILYSNISPSEYFASKLRKAIEGFGTDHKSLIRIVVGRSDVDIPLIKQYYNLLYKKDLIEDIKSEISGEYQKLVLAILSR